MPLCGKAANADRGKDLRKDLPIVAHEQSVEECAESYGLSLQAGLTSQQVLDSRAKHGENRLTPPNIKPKW